MKWIYVVATMTACHATVDPKLEAAELSCVAEAGTRSAADACRQKVRAAWASSHDASSLVSDGGLRE